MEITKQLVRYDNALLIKLIGRDKATIVGWCLSNTTEISLNNPEKLNRNTTIHYHCYCGEFGKRIFKALNDSGAYCKIHAKEKQKERCRIKSLEVYGVPNPMMNQSIRAKADATVLKIHGVKNISQSESIKQKKAVSTMNTHGVPCPFQSECVKEKSRKTNIERRGVAFPTQSKEVIDKIEKINTENTGYAYPSQCPERRAKAVATWVKNHGVENPAQSQEIMTKTQHNAKKFKSFKFPSGEIRKVQGYEPFALNELLSKGYTDEQIITDRKSIPRITYADGKKRYYFPDIFIPHENKIIEVKSTWTLTCNPENIELKKQATISAGYSYELWCYNAKGIRV